MIFNKKEIDNVFFIDENSLAKETIVILHGWRQDKESWGEIIKILSKNYRVIVFDLPAFGESQNNRFLNFNVSDYSTTIVNIIKKLNIDNINLICHSFGGRIGITITHDNPNLVKNLILFSTAGLIHKTTKEKIIDTLLPFKGIVKKLIPEKVIKSFRSRDYVNSNELKQIFLNEINYDVKPLLSEVKTRTLIIWGDKDSELDVKIAYEFKSLLVNSELCILKGKGHFAHLESPNLFCAKILDFLK